MILDHFEMEHILRLVVCDGCEYLVPLPPYTPSIFANILITVHQCLLYYMTMMIVDIKTHLGIRKGEGEGGSVHIRHLKIQIPLSKSIHLFL